MDDAPLPVPASLSEVIAAYIRADSAVAGARDDGQRRHGVSSAGGHLAEQATTRARYGGEDTDHGEEGEDDDDDGAEEEDDDDDEEEEDAGPPRPLLLTLRPPPRS